MMRGMPGSAPLLLLSMPQMADPNFARAVVLLCDYTADGAFGLVVNRQMTEPAWTMVKTEPPIAVDRDLLKQAVLNLATNALEAMANGGLLRVTVARLDDKLTLEVADNGPGIPLENMQKVFQLHFTTKKAGSGIGLAMTYRAVQLHNGTISFTSEAGAGSTFRLEFPATVQHA